MKDNLFTTDTTREKLTAGINKIASTVGATMGTGGSNVIIEAIESPGHLMTNDGYTIASSIMLSDPIEDMGRKILLEAINRANKASGDGSSTTCVLTAAIIAEGMKHDKDASPMEIKRSLEACLPLIEESIKTQTRDIAGDLKILEQVATISAEDPQIGATIAKIYGEIGPKGIIHWDVSKTPEDTYTIGTGITVEGAGFISPYMADATENGQSTNQIRIKKPKIMVTKQKITSAADFNGIAAALFADEVKDLVVFCDDIDPLVLGDVIKTRAMRGFRIVIVKMPVLWKDQWFIDLQDATGAKAVDAAAGFPMKALTKADLGTCANIVITKDDTYLDGVADMSFKIETLEAEATDDSLNRAARLNTRTARYFVGAHSDSALSYRRLKVEDAISAAYHALNGGIVAGGGIALLNAGLKFIADSSVGGLILHKALQAPLRQIAANVGATSSEVVGGDMGLDTHTMKVVDMFEAGIVDPATVVLNAVKNAISVAATVLTTKAIITLPRAEASDMAMMQPPVSR